MKLVPAHISVLMIFFFCTTITAQTFPCDGRMIISHTEYNTTTISYHLSIPFGGQFFSPMARYRNASFDALGFNSLDNFIYGVQGNTNAIVRLKQNNTFDTVGVVSMVDTLNSNAGDCSPDGFFLCHENSLDQILVFDVVDSFELVDRIDLFWDPNSTYKGVFNTRIYDFAIDPNNPRVAYSFQGYAIHSELEPEETRGYMLRINVDRSDPNVGMVTPMAQVDSLFLTHLGAVLAYPEFGLTGFGSALPGLNPTQNIYYSINPFGGEVNNTGTRTPNAEFSDGCSCPYAFTFTHLAPQEGLQCSNDEALFTFTISNYSYNEIEDAIFLDSFPEGIIIEEISGDFGGLISDGTGIGTRIISIEQFYIPPKSKIEIVVKVRSIDLEIGFTTNQAFLKNLPDRYGNEMPSDDPFTSSNRGDASRFSVFSKRIDDLTWVVTAPSDCIIANDASVLLSSPQFIPDQGYEISLRNKIGWQESTWDVIADNNGSFLLDSLIPGDYQLFKIRSKSDNCSLALKDTTIIVEAPNDQLSLIIGSNSPVCEGELIRLNSALFPGGEVDWRGPKLYASEQFNPVIEGTTPELSGQYKVEGTYGYCVQNDTTEMLVAPAVEASISGQVEYCERDTLILQAEGLGDTLFYQWSGPDNLRNNRRLIVNESISPENEGYYELMINNGACRDTVGVQITVLPTPTIALPSLIKTDYCEPLILKADISGDNNVSYQWSPEIGLSCSDCPNPEVIPVVQSGYKMKVENTHSCTDSAFVKVELEKDKILLTPNVFYPNSRQNNDRFIITPRCVVQQINKFLIYDRWGNEVFSKQSLNPAELTNFWNGRIDGTIANSGVYIWVAEIELVDGRVLVLDGDITLLR